MGWPHILKCEERFCGNPTVVLHEVRGELPTWAAKPKMRRMSQPPRLFLYLSQKTCLCMSLWHSCATSVCAIKPEVASACVVQDCASDRYPKTASLLGRTTLGVWKQFGGGRLEKLHNLMWQALLHCIAGPRPQISCS